MQKNKGTYLVGKNSGKANDAAEEVDLAHHYFRTEDWLAAAFTFLLSAVAFIYYLAPEVTLQDSGELVTGAFTFGVPHPPGYPLWAFLGWVWSNFLVPFGNPAWRIGLMSAITGASLVGVLTVLMTRSTRMLLNMLPFGEEIDTYSRHWIALLIGMSTALFFGFNRGVWLWACVSEMRALNVFSFVLMAFTFFGWMMRPEKRGFLYVTLLIYGLSTANHQTVAIMAGPFLAGAFIVGLEKFYRQQIKSGRLWGEGSFTLLMRSLDAFWELTAAACLMATVVFAAWAWLQSPNIESMTAHPAFPKGVAALVAGICVVALGFWQKLWSGKRSLLCFAILFIGCSFYLYMPLAASTNPPMNWGYTATKEGFLHHITRGQYQQLVIASIFSSEFFLKIKLFILALIGQNSLIFTLSALVSLFVLIRYWKKLSSPWRSWMLFVWIAFCATSFGLLTIINPAVDRQEQEITIKFFAPAHGFYAMLIGYGLAFMLAFILAKWRQKVLVRVLSVLLLAMPFVTFERNWALCEKHNHDFGYLFGYLMFNPGGGYEPMATNAVLYGGTDPGRFVPTYMIYCESRVAPQDRFFDRNFDRSDVYIITQNALADNTYMNYIRDQYDFTRPANTGWFQRWLKRDKVYPQPPIRIPSQDDGNMAFQKYIADLRTGRIPPNADVKVEGGRVSVQGVQGVMTINGILAQWIFEKNKDKHDFYVEESYVLPWMYPYMRPAGIILKLEKNPLPSPQENPSLWAEIAKKDRAYWDDLAAKFMARPEFRRSDDAKKAFSKLRSAIAGLYGFRGMIAEAEYAFRQSLTLCPESPEASFRLADLFMQQHRYAEASKVMEAYWKLDPYNGNVASFINSIQEMDRLDKRRMDLEKSLASGSAEISKGLELASIYQRMNMPGPFRDLTQSMLNDTSLPAQVYLSVAQLYGNVRLFDPMIGALQKYLTRDPNNYRVIIDLAAAQLALDRQRDALASIRRAIEVAGEAARGVLRSDERFEPLRPNREFQILVLPGSAPNLDVSPFIKF